MAIKSRKMGPGTFTIGEVGTLLDLTSQVASLTVKWSVDAEDSVPVLSDEVLEGDESFTATVSANLILDMTEDGFVDYTWANKGLAVPFTFVPSTAAGRSISGIVKLRPVDVGGEVKKTMRQDIEWPCVGEPELGADLT